MLKGEPVQVDHSPKAQAGAGTGRGMSGNDDFFGGSITPSPRPGAQAPAPGRFNQHQPHNKEYGSYSSPTSAAGPGAKPHQPVVIAIVAVIALAAVAFLGYRMYFGPKIVLPEDLLGLERANLNTDLEESIDDLDTSSLGGSDVDVQIGIYGSGTDILAVIAGDAGTTDPGEIDQFFNSVSEEMKSAMPTGTLTTESAGTRGGTMKCFKVPQSGAGGCAWVGDETFGMVVAGPGRDFADTTRQVREAIEH